MVSESRQTKLAKNRIVYWEKIIACAEAGHCSCLARTSAFIHPPSYFLYCIREHSESLHISPAVCERGTLTRDGASRRGGARAPAAGASRSWSCTSRRTSGRWLEIAGCLETDTITLLLKVRSELRSRAVE